MFSKSLRAVAVTAVTLNAFAAAAASATARPGTVSLAPLGSYASGVFGEGAAEIVAYDAATMRLFVINAEANSVDVLDLADPSHPTRLFAIDATPWGGGVNSVAVHDGLVALAGNALDQHPRRGRHAGVRLGRPHGAPHRAGTAR